MPIATILRGQEFHPCGAETMTEAPSEGLLFALLSVEFVYLMPVIILSIPVYTITSFTD